MGRPQELVDGVDAVEAEARAQVVKRTTGDAAEAARAFAEKREPHFTGQ